MSLGLIELVSYLKWDSGKILILMEWSLREIGVEAHRMTFPGGNMGLTLDSIILLVGNHIEDSFRKCKLFGCGELKARVTRSPSLLTSGLHRIISKENKNGGRGVYH